MLDYTTNDQSFGDEHHCPVHMMMTEFTLPTYLYLDPPVLDRTMGSKSSPSAPVCSRSPDAVPIDSSVHQVLFKCGPSHHVFVGRPRHLPLPRGVHGMAWLAGRPGGILPTTWVPYDLAPM